MHIKLTGVEDLEIIHKQYIVHGFVAVENLKLHSIVRRLVISDLVDD